MELVVGGKPEQRPQDEMDSKLSTDDNLVIGESEEQLHILINTLIEECTTIGIDINTIKRIIFSPTRVSITEKK